MVEYQAAKACFFEIFLMPLAVIMTSTVYYRFLFMRRSARHDPYTLHVFAEFRTATASENRPVTRQ
uniref:Uncharacterized protein n=1 Tax=Glossina austeni TaxID=7395 RepID=A0A1A9V4Z4_GLOAU